MRNAVAVGLADRTAELHRWVVDQGGDPARAKLLTGGVIVDVSTVSQWIGVEPLVSGSVNLVAPVPKSGDAPGQWLHFAGDHHANTSDLIAVMIAD